LHVEALPEPMDLVEGVVHLGSGERLRRDFAVEDETATFTLRSEGVTFGPFVGSWDDQRTWDLGLNPDVPLELEISLSVGQSNINLMGLTVSDVEVDIGVGKTTVVLPDEGRFRAEMEGAIGETVVVIPESTAARIRIDTGLAVRQLPASYQHRGHVYTSPDYESAENRVDLKVNQAIGNVTIRHSEGR
jgi:hypothetical protein